MLDTAIVVTLLTAAVVRGEVTVRIGDVTSLKGQSVNRLVGNGLVVGLGGTGDGDQYEVTMRALAQTLGNLGAPVTSLKELKDTKNVAMVIIDAVIPEHGAREGDRIDVHVSAMGGAKSLAGGRLIIAPLVYEDLNVQKIFAFASGPLELDSGGSLTVATVRRGAVIQQDVLVGFTATGASLPFTNDWIESDAEYITLVLENAHAGWGLAVAIAESVNAELSLAADVERVAIAADPKNVIVLVPPFQRGDPASWIRDIEDLSFLMPNEEARVTVDRSTGTIVVSGDATISPVIVSQKGMTVVVRVPPPNADEPRVESQRFVALDTNRGTDANVSDLLQALNQLNVPIDDRIAILTQVQKAGKLHAKLLFKE